MQTKSRKKIVIIVILLAAVSAGAAYSLSLRLGGGERYTGYVVSENIYLSAAVSGKIHSVFVSQGQRVAPGDAIFAMDATSFDARVAKAEAQIKQYEAQLASQEAILRSALANRDAAETEARRAEDDYQRYLRVHTQKPGAVSEQDVEYNRSKARLNKQLHEAAAREAEAAAANIELARAQINTARAELADILKQRDDLTPLSPVEGYVEDVMFQPGEWAAANGAVVSIVPLGGLKIRFYVPQEKIADYPLGTELAVSIDGRESLRARVSYTAPRPEYTPPVIYSLESRAKLVFLLEAATEDTRGLRPGQPLDVRPL